MRKNAGLGGVFNLWIAVVFRAYLDAISEKKDDQPYKNNGKNFFLNNDDQIGSFGWICKNLEMDEKHLRRIILKKISETNEAEIIRGRKELHHSGEEICEVIGSDESIAEYVGEELAGEGGVEGSGENCEGDC